MTAVLQASDLTKHFQARRGLFGRTRGVVRAVDGISFAVEPARTLGVVGESGCGKTTTAKLVLGLEEPSAGAILFDGRDLARLDTPGRRQYRRSVQAVFQDPYASLNPRMRISAIIAEPLITNETVDPAEVRRRILELLDLVGLPERSAELFPHEFSGGQRQRIAIARALVLSPRLVVLDEPVSALDVSIRAQILNLLRDLQDRLGLAYLFIAHDLAAVAHMSHEIVVMYLGKIVESGQARTIARAALHPYTKALFSAALPSHPDERHEEVPLSGEVPSPINPPSGCHFHPRCPHATARCAREEPKLAEVEGRRVACHLFS
ncbi:MAG: ABC transporter ATP-binding protein [Reyranellales bacterium]